MPPIPDTVRQAVAVDIRAGVLGRNAIARKHGIAVGSVHNIVVEQGLTGYGDRSSTEHMTRALINTNRMKRAQIAAGLLDDVEKIRERFWQPYKVAVGGREGAETVELDEPDAGALRNYATAAAVLLDKHVALDRHDQDGGISELGSMLSGLADKFGLRRDDGVGDG